MLLDKVFICEDVFKLMNLLEREFKLKNKEYLEIKVSKYNGE